MKQVAVVLVVLALALSGIAWAGEKEELTYKAIALQERMQRLQAEFEIARRDLEVAQARLKELESSDKKADSPDKKAPDKAR